MKHTIIQAKVLGFCSGVKLAMGLAIKARDEFPEKRIFTFDELIHNMDAIKFLESKNIFSLDKKAALSKNSDYKDAVIIVCAHGIEAEAMTVLNKKFYRVIDATCPHVLQSQKKAEKAARAGYNVILVGEKKHQEVLSIRSHAELIGSSSCLIIENLEDTEKLKREEIKKPICVIGQTTLKQSEYQAIIEVLARKFSKNCSSRICENTKELNAINEDFYVYNTICPATQKRQEALIDIAENCDAILVVGGKNSTNTQRLFQTAKKIKKASYLIENASQIPLELFNYEKIGITAGASTPDFIINEIKIKLTS